MASWNVLLKMQTEQGISSLHWMDTYNSLKTNKEQCMDSKQ